MQRTPESPFTHTALSRCAAKAQSSEKEGSRQLSKALNFGHNVFRSLLKSQEQQEGQTKALLAGALLSLLGGTMGAVHKQRRTAAVCWLGCCT